MRAKLDELTEENRSLRRTLTDAQTTLALQRSEVAGVKAQCEQKCYELDKYERPITASQSLSHAFIGLLAREIVSSPSISRTNI